MMNDLLSEGIWHFYPFDIIKVIFKSNSVSINKKNRIDIKCSLLKKTLHSEVGNILHKNVKKAFQILSNDYNFFRP